MGGPQLPLGAAPQGSARQGLWPPCLACAPSSPRIPECKGCLQLAVHRTCFFGNVPLAAARARSCGPSWAQPGMAQG